jgi:N-acetylglucosamine-6-sulfatase
VLRKQEDRACAVPEEVEPVSVPNKKPQNVMFILSDDRRYDAMSFMGHQFVETPRMDSMANLAGPQ